MELRHIRGNCNKIPQFRTIPVSNMLRIRHLKLQKKRKRGARGGRHNGDRHDNNVNSNNLIKISTERMRPTKEPIKPTHRDS